jgi:hypothetical protein
MASQFYECAMYVCMHVCMYVCMDGYMCLRRDFERMMFCKVYACWCVCMWVPARLRLHMLMCMYERESVCVCVYMQACKPITALQLACCNVGVVFGIFVSSSLLVLES